MRFFLGVDVGSSKTHAVIADENGRVLGFGRAGAGNHEVVGYPGLVAALHKALDEACAAAGVAPGALSAAGFGVAGYDWPSERAATLAAIGELGLAAPLEAVNDAVLGILAGSPRGWGITVVSGTGCNCWGWDAARRKVGQVTGWGRRMGEAAGAGELVYKAVQCVAQAWTRRGPETALCAAFIERTGAAGLGDLVEGLASDRYSLDAAAAPLIFEVARAGDPLAVQLVEWAGCELGELVNAVVRQLEFENLDFDLVLVGSMFRNGPPLIEPLVRTVHALAPAARPLPLDSPPVLGAVLLAMEQAGLPAAPEMRAALATSIGNASNFRQSIPPTLFPPREVG